MNDKENEKNDKKYKIIIGGLVFVILILIGLLIYIATKKTNSNNNSNSTTTTSITTSTTTTTRTTTTTTTTTPKNLATNFNMFPLNDDSDVIEVGVGDLYRANIDTRTNFQNVYLKKGNLNYTARCNDYDESYKRCFGVEFNINNTLITLPEETTDGAVYLLVKNNNIVLIRTSESQGCAFIKIYRNSKLVYTVDHISTTNDTLVNYLKSKNKSSDDTIRYTNNKLHYLVDTIDGYTILKTIDLSKDTIKEEAIAKVKDNKETDLNCYNNFGE